MPGSRMIMACALAPLLLCAEVEQMGMASWRVTPPQCVQVGDLVFRRDQGMWSWLFIDASRREKRFSHVGVVVACGQDPLIVHADADERTGTGCVRQQPWRAFFAESRDAAVYRYAGATPNGRFALPEVSLGIIPGAGGYTWAKHWARYPKEAMDWVNSGETIDSKYAQWLGVIDARVGYEPFGFRK